jgi:hypothetical protein
MDGRRSPQSQSISQLTLQPDTIPSCYRRPRHAEFQPLPLRHRAASSHGHIDGRCSRTAGAGLCVLVLVRIRSYDVTDAAVHDSQALDALLTGDNTSADVFGDSAYHSAEIEAKLRARVEHVFGTQQTSPGGRMVRTIDIVRARAKIGLQNLVYNIRRLVTLERLAAA